MFENILIGLIVVSSLIIIATTLMMEPKTGAGSAFGQDSNAFGKSVHQTKDRLLNKITVVAAFIFIAGLLGILAIYSH